jgi:hypothetical protein
MGAPQAVLLVAHYIVSMFGMQIGSGVMQAYPYSTMEVCSIYKKEMEGEFKLDLEYRMITRTDCVTIKKYNEIVAKQKGKPVE